MAQVISPVTAFLALVLLHSTVLARQGLMFSSGSHSDSTAAVPVEDGPNQYSSQAKHQESVGFRSEQTSPQTQSLRMESHSNAQKRKDAAEEIVNLLHKDYFHKPSGRPPIHNRFTPH